MTARFSRAILALLIPFALASCVLTPGKFVSTLRIDADRHFAFTYTGEVIAIDMGDEFSKGMKAGAKDEGTKDDGTTDDGADPTATDDDNTPVMQQIGLQKADDDTSKKAATDTKNRAIATALAKESGYRKVVYLGDGKFSIDYAVAGTLDRGFVWPYNLDAEIIFPFVVIEVRANNTVRIKAPGFANDNAMGSKGLGGMGGMGGGAADKAPSKLDGSFTLDTDAEIVSQNNEDGAVAGAGGRRTVTWKATPTTKDAPTAVLRVK